MIQLQDIVRAVIFVHVFFIRNMLYYVIALLMYYTCRIPSLVLN